MLDKLVANTARTVYALGHDQYVKYYKEVVSDRTYSSHDPIKRKSKINGQDKVSGKDAVKLFLSSVHSTAAKNQ